MLDTFWESLKNMLKSRLLPMSVIFTLLFFILVQQIFSMQIVNGEENANEAEITETKVRDLKSTRGNIYDCNGKLLAYDALSYAVTLEDVGILSNSAEKNTMIYEMIELIESCGDTISCEFPINLKANGSFEFTISGTSLMNFKKEVYSISASKKLTDEQIAATAEDVFEYLCYSTDASSPKFLIDESYSVQDAMKILSVRYNLFLQRYKKWIPIRVAADVSAKTVAAIKEASAELPGVEILSETHRVYNDSKYFAQILGYTGTITNEEYDALEKDAKDNYTQTDQIGKTGLEKEFENYLHGKKGAETVTVNENYRVVDVNNRNEPEAGNDLYLTIDAALQKKYYKILEEKIASILLANIVNSTSTGSKGTSSDNITIPIYDVYYALFDNNLIVIDSLNDKNATSLEKNVYKKYLSKRKNVLNQLKKVMSVSSKTTNKAAGEDMETYLEYVYTFLSDNHVLLKNNIDKESDIYKNYIDNKISLSRFLQYALSNNWIDLEILEIGDEFYSTEELYQKLLSYIEKGLSEDAAFAKKIYKTLIYDYTLSGKEVCLLLYDQGILEYDEASIEALQKGTISAYDFIREKIKSLEITPGELALAPYSGSVVITDVNTGQVKALVSYPGYDNNKLANQIDYEYFSYLNSSKAYPLINRPMQQSNAPGSTFKMVVATAALEEGIVGANEKIYSKVTFDKVGDPAKCWKTSSPHGDIDITDAIQVSCNYFFYEMGYRLSLQGTNYNNQKGLKTLKKYAKMFGLGDKSGIELYEAEPKISDTDSIRSAIGQGSNSYTTSQISRYVTTVANKGTCYNLTLIDQVKSLDGKVVYKKEPEVYGKVNSSSQTWSLIHDGMYKVLNGSESSSTPLFKDLGVTVAGKTGTAQISKSQPNHALFVSFAPYEKPEISVTVEIVNGYTSHNAADVARSIYLDYFNLKGKDKRDSAAVRSNPAVYGD